MDAPDRMKAWRRGDGIPDAEIALRFAGCRARGEPERSELTQRQAAERVGVSQPAWRAWETGEDIPRIDNVIRIAEVTGIPVSAWASPPPAAPASAPPPEAA
jgi:transcriptional regulator with XRE-family HTH domain